MWKQLQKQYDADTSLIFEERTASHVRYIRVTDNAKLELVHTAVVRLPEGYRDFREAYAALPAYCRARFSTRGCKCEGGLDGEAVPLGIGRLAWSHPSLRYPQRLTKI